MSVLQKALVDLLNTKFYAFVVIERMKAMVVDIKQSFDKIEESR